MDGEKSVERVGIGGPVVKEAIATNPPVKWLIMKRDMGTWTRAAGPFTSEADAAAKLAELKELTLGVEFMLLSAN